MPIINFDKEQRRIITNNWKRLKNVGKVLKLIVI